VLAYGYGVSGSVVTVRVYDPNSGPSDDVRIRFTAASGNGTEIEIEHNISIRWPVRGFFVTAYSPGTPPSVTGAAEPDGPSTA
jgi:hypothetical protein